MVRLRNDDEATGIRFRTRPIAVGKCHVQTSTDRFGPQAKGAIRDRERVQAGTDYQGTENPFVWPDEYVGPNDELPKRSIFSVVPSMSGYRNNLTALSQVHNLYFVAYQGRIFVYRPQSGTRQTLPREPNIQLIPPASPQSKLVGGTLDKARPHCVNHIMTGFLGDAEIVLACYDDGDVVAFYTAAVVKDIRAKESDMSHKHSPPFFHDNVGRSAWGLAIHQNSRLIAVSSNYHEVIVFAFAVSCSPSLLGEDGLIEEDRNYVEGWVRQRGRNWRIVLVLGRQADNVPNICFLDGKDGKAEKIAAVDITGAVWFVDIWKSKQPATRVPALDSTKVQSQESFPGNSRGWGVLAISEACFLRVSTVEELVGLPQQFLHITEPRLSEKQVFCDVSDSLKIVPNNPCPPRIWNLRTMSVNNPILQPDLMGFAGGATVMVPVAPPGPALPAIEPSNDTMFAVGMAGAFLPDELSSSEDEQEMQDDEDDADLQGDNEAGGDGVAEVEDQDEDYHEDEEEDDDDDEDDDEDGDGDDDGDLSLPHVIPNIAPLAGADEANPPMTTQDQIDAMFDPTWLPSQASLEELGLAGAPPGPPSPGPPAFISPPPPLMTPPPTFSYYPSANAPPPISQPATGSLVIYPQGIMPETLWASLMAPGAASNPSAGPAPFGPPFTPESPDEMTILGTTTAPAYQGTGLPSSAVGPEAVWTDWTSHMLGVPMTYEHKMMARYARRAKKYVVDTEWLMRGWRLNMIYYPHSETTRLAPMAPGSQRAFALSRTREHNRNQPRLGHASERVAAGYRILRTFEKDFEMFQIPYAPRGNPKEIAVLCTDAVCAEHLRWRELSRFFRATSRLSFLLQVPEFSLVVLGSATGRVILATPTRLEKRASDPTGKFEWEHGIRVENILPLEWDEKEHKRPTRPLYGVALSPVPEGNHSQGSQMRRYRLLLHYMDHFIFSYEITRHDETGKLCVF